MVLPMRLNTSMFIRGKSMLMNPHFRDMNAVMADRDAMSSSMASDPDKMILIDSSSE